MSPKIDAQLSQRTEGRTRDKQNPKTKENEKRNDKNKNTETDKSKAKDTQTEKKKGGIPTADGDSDRRSTSRLVPYVDLPPRGTTRLTQPVNQSQSLPKEEPTYKHRAPVEIGLDIEKLVDTVLEMEITVPLRSLAGVSGAIQKEIRKQVTKVRLLVENKVEVKTWLQEEEDHKIDLKDLPLESFMIQEKLSEDMPEGSLVAGDPVLQFLTNNENADINRLVVGRISEPLRAIYTTINGVGQEECLLDCGSMIVSMSKKVATQLGLIWDPSITIDMESASKHVERTLGVARNVCFSVGGLKFFLQVHILEDPPYRILLGRPFEILAKTVTQTNADGSSEVVVTDPNTKRIAVIPTYRRGESPEALQKTKIQDF